MQLEGRGLGGKNHVCSRYTCLSDLFLNRIRKKSRRLLRVPEIKGKEFARGKVRDRARKFFRLGNLSMMLRGVSHRNARARTMFSGAPIPEVVCVYSNKVCLESKRMDEKLLDFGKKKLVKNGNLTSVWWGTSATERCKPQFFSEITSAKTRGEILEGRETKLRKGKNTVLNFLRKEVRRIKL